MNILPKKRWHVRTKDNIARVRKDEAVAREEEQKRQEKLDLAESEARINYLRRQSGIPEQHEKAESAGNDTTHKRHLKVGVDLFADFKTHIKTTNKELEKEQKEEQEKYEKQIGYLTYLGQDTNEALKLRSWYEVAPHRPEIGDLNATEKDLKTKYAQDPLTLIKTFLPTGKCEATITRSTNYPPPIITIKSVEETVPSVKKHKSKKHKKRKNLKDIREKSLERKLHKRSSEQVDRKHGKLEKLRQDRLRREAAEKARQDALFAPKESEIKQISSTPRIVQKYNSQFNPELAKQNMV